MAYIKIKNKNSSYYQNIQQNEYNIFYHIDFNTIKCF